MTFVTQAVGKTTRQMRDLFEGDFFQGFVICDEPGQHRGRPGQPSHIAFGRRDHGGAIETVRLAQEEEHLEQRRHLQRRAAGQLTQPRDSHQNG